MTRWAVLENTGYRFDYFGEVEAPTVRTARIAAARRLGGLYMDCGPNRVKRQFRVRKLP